MVTSLWPGFVDRYGDRLDDDHLALCDRFIGVLGPWLAARPTPATVTHGDFRLDNLLFRPGRPAVGGRLADRRPGVGGLRRGLLRGRLPDRGRPPPALGPLGRRLPRRPEAAGVSDFGRDRLEAEYRSLCFGGLVMSIGASMLVKRTERGDEMFVTSVPRMPSRPWTSMPRPRLPGRSADDQSPDGAPSEPTIPPPVDPADESGTTPGPSAPLERVALSRLRGRRRGHRRLRPDRPVSQPGGDLVDHGDPGPGSPLVTSVAYDLPVAGAPGWSSEPGVIDVAAVVERPLRTLSLRGTAPAAPSPTRRRLPPRAGDPDPDRLWT